MSCQEILGPEHDEGGVVVIEAVAERGWDSDTRVGQSWSRPVICFTRSQTARCRSLERSAGTSMSTCAEVA
jgi:hypothetical protein